MVNASKSLRRFGSFRGRREKRFPINFNLFLFIWCRREWNKKKRPNEWSWEMLESFFFPWRDKKSLDASAIIQIVIENHLWNLQPAGLIEIFPLMTRCVSHKPLATDSTFNIPSARNFRLQSLAQRWACHWERGSLVIQLKWWLLLYHDSFSLFVRLFWPRGWLLTLSEQFFGVKR